MPSFSIILFWEKKWSLYTILQLNNFCVVSADHLQSWFKAFMEWFALLIEKYWNKTLASPLEVANQCQIVYISYPLKKLQAIVCAYLFNKCTPSSVDTFQMWRLLKSTLVISNEEDIAIFFPKGNQFSPTVMLCLMF